MADAEDLKSFGRNIVPVQVREAPLKILNEILKLAIHWIEFPNAHICKHSVVADVLSMLEENGYPVDINFTTAAKHVVFAEDEAIDALKKLII